MRTDDPYLIIRSVPRILEKPKNRLSQSIAGTESNMDLPKWLRPYEESVIFAARFLTEGGGVPLHAFGFDSCLVYLKGWKLDGRKRKSFWFHVERFQQVLLRSKSGLAGEEASESNKLAFHGSHGQISRNTSSNTPKNQAFFTFHL